MSVDQATVRHIARLARIAVTDDEARALESELSALLDWVEQLGEVDTDGVEPMTSVVHMEMRKRDDGITDGNCADAVVANAPEREGHFFVVPKVIE